MVSCDFAWPKNVVAGWPSSRAPLDLQQDDLEQISALEVGTGRLVVFANGEQIDDAS
jgi:hypothetical protein